MFQSISAFLLAIVQAVLGFVGLGTPTKPVQYKDPYPIVFVHGLGGWGEGAALNLVSPHWGMNAGSIKKYLNEQGYEAYAASVAPVSSAWDRACELYAHLTGTRTDYGAAHAKAHGHDRYGYAYKKPLIENWSSRRKIYLLGHSFGGATVRLFAQLCEQGSVAEREARQENISPLFTSILRGRIAAVVTLAAPHNGSTAAESYLKEDGEPSSDIQNTLLDMAKAAMIVPLIERVYPFHLQQFGLDARHFWLHPIQTWRRMEAYSSADDSAAVDLTVDGAKAVNAQIKCQPGIYYFSYAAQATKPDGKGNQIPNDLVWDMFKGSAAAMGKKRLAYTTPGGVVIDAKWLPNDSLVNVVSAQYPFGEPHQTYNPKKIVKGTWQVMPLITNWDHVDFAGGMQLKGGAPGVREFYLGMAKMLQNLPKTR